MINIRKLAALDIVFHGSKIILAEFAAGVFLPLALGLLSLFRGRARWQIVLGVYLVLLAINYVPLLIYGLMIVFRGDAHAEVADELAHKDRIASTYMAQSLFLVVPLVVPVLALAQSLRSRK